MLFRWSKSKILKFSLIRTFGVSDHYKTLRVDRKATEKEIKQAFNKLAKQYHPDVVEDEENAEKFKEIVTAYGVLSNKEKRSVYDLDLQHNQTKTDSSDSSQSHDKPEDQVLSWLRKKYAETQKPFEPEVPPHIKGDQQKTNNSDQTFDLEKTTTFRLMEFGLVM